MLSHLLRRTWRAEDVPVTHGVASSSIVGEMVAEVGGRVLFLYLDLESFIVATLSGCDTDCSACKVTVVAGQFCLWYSMVGR